MPLERLDQVALDHRAVGADDAPGDDVGVRAGLVDQAGDERAVPGQRVDAAVEGADLVEPLLGVGGVVDVADRLAVEARPGLRPPRRASGCLPHPVSRVATTGRRPTISSSVRRTGCGPTYVIGWRPPLPGTPYDDTASEPSPPAGWEPWKGCAPWNGCASVERVRVDAAHQHDVVEPDAAHRLEAERRPRVLQQHPAVGRDRRLLVAHGQVEPDHPQRHGRSPADSRPGRVLGRRGAPSPPSRGSRPPPAAVRSPRRCRVPRTTIRRGPT